MAFYKRDGDSLLVSDSKLVGPGYELLIESKDQYTYPVDGWYWFETLDQAMSSPNLRQVGSVQSVTMRQARLALLAAGLLPSVDAAIAALSEPQRSEAKIEWEYSQEVQRHNGFVSSVAPALGLTSSDIDNLFVVASTL